MSAHLSLQDAGKTFVSSVTVTSEPIVLGRQLILILVACHSCQSRHAAVRVASLILRGGLERIVLDGGLFRRRFPAPATSCTGVRGLCR